MGRAGNDHSDASGFSPASCDNVITVAAISRTAHRSGYSNFGDNVDIAAPGGDGSDSVLSTINTGTTTQSTEGYVGYQGTSMATPHVAGTAALMQSVHVNSPAFVEAIIKKNSRAFPITCTGCGAGIVDANAAVLAASTPALMINDVKITEGGSGTKLATFTVSLSQTLGSAVTFDVATADSTATAGSDYVAGTFTGQSIPAGQTSKTFSVTINGDSAVESDETFLVNVSNVVGIVVADGQGQGTIVNDDANPLTNGVPVNVPPATANKQFFYYLTVPSGATNLVFNTSGGTGDADLYVKFGSLPTLSNFDCVSGGTTTTESCPIPSAQAGNYYVMVNAFTGITGVSLTGSYSGGSVTPSLSIGDVSISEGNSGTKVATFTVNLSQASASNVTYNIATANGTATAGSDYVASSLNGQSIPAGQTSKTFSVTINGDTASEANETFFVNVSSVVGATVADAQALGTITNDDTPSLSIGDVSISEGNSGTKLATFTVSLSGPASTAVTYNVSTPSSGSATAGSDYVALPVTAQSIPAGQTSKTISVTINGDTTNEANESFFVNVTSVVGATVADATAVGTIANDDFPSLSIGDVSLNEGNSGTTLMTFTVHLSAASLTAVTYNVATPSSGSATAGSDYVTLPVTAQTIPAGQTSKTVSVTINGDATIEASETFFVNVSSIVGATVADPTAVGTITNDDFPSLSIGDVAISEGNSGTKLMTFTVQLSAAAGTAVTYNVSTPTSGTATANVDYVTLPVTAQTILAGQSSKTVSVTINGDATIEPNETFFVNVSSVHGATVADPTAVGTITNDD
jgi:hypothetical protein